MCEQSQCDTFAQQQPIQIESLRVVVRKQNILSICFKHSFDSLVLYFSVFSIFLTFYFSEKNLATKEITKKKPPNPQQMTPAIWEEVNKA